MLNNGIKNEQRLVRRVLQGDLQAFREIISQYEKLVSLIVWRTTGSKADHEDLCQEIFIKVYEKLNSYRTESRLSTWVGKIAYHHCLNHVRKKTD